jgi:hypothetical protein
MTARTRSTAAALTGEPAPDEKSKSWLVPEPSAAVRSASEALLVPVSVTFIVFPLQAVPSMPVTLTVDTL